ncbi:MAG: hypothetical protein CL596_10850 [Alteromonas sp.]|nr:hypothetical protein [Alteromonas sp.]|tara:strand:- start:84 stop:851 length:768 start_codon:yes stop_codon:yes gene_type:complete
MRNLYLFIWLLLGLFNSSCNKDDNNNSQDSTNNFNSQICNTISGASAVYWDYAHGLPTGLTQIPTISNPGGQFIHSQYPGLGFTYPAGYTATEILIPEVQALGVNVLRNDNNALWRYIPSITLQGNVGVNSIIASEINAMFSQLNFNGTPNVLCTTTQTGSIGGGFQNTFGARFIQFGTFRALVWVNTIYEPSLNVTFASLSVSYATTNEFDNEVLNTFLPISFQLLIISDGVRDSDADGFPDNQDNFPFDPTRH